MYIHKVNYYETDKMGVTHHSNYIRWMEEARVDFLEKAGFLVKHIKTYEECLSIDYDRKNMNEKASELIEVLAIK
jgi:YbgC/YbaW family acyl-CoA thioester hydrolase